MSEQNVFYTTRRIGNTTYKVRVELLEDGMENMEEKILRMIQNEAGNMESGCGIIGVPQTSRQSERSA